MIIPRFRVNTRNMRKNVNYIVPVFLLLDLTYLTHSSGVTIVGFEKVNVSWVMLQSNLHIIAQNQQ